MQVCKQGTCFVTKEERFRELGLEYTSPCWHFRQEKSGTPRKDNGIPQEPLGCKRSLWFLLVSFAVIYLGWVGAHATDEICLSVFSPLPCDFWRSNSGHWAWRLARAFTC